MCGNDLQAASHENAADLHFLCEGHLQAPYEGHWSAQEDEIRQDELHTLRVGYSLEVDAVSFNERVPIRSNWNTTKYSHECAGHTPSDDDSGNSPY